MFNLERWHESKVKHRIWEELIIYAKAAWDRVIKQKRLVVFSAAAMSQGFDKTWGARNVLCRRNNLQIKWNWKRQRRHVVLSSMEIVLVVWGLSLAGGVGVVLGW